VKDVLMLIDSILAAFVSQLGGTKRQLTAFAAALLLQDD
jgi:hypothetical protein